MNNLINYVEDPECDGCLAYKHTFGEMIEGAITVMNDELFGELDDISEMTGESGSRSKQVLANNDLKKMFVQSLIESNSTGINTDGN